MKQFPGLTWWGLPGYTLILEQHLSAFNLSAEGTCNVLLDLAEASFIFYLVFRTFYNESRPLFPALSKTYELSSVFINST